MAKTTETTKINIENYEILSLKRKYELALIGAEFCVKDIDGTGIYIVDSYLKELYRMHVLVAEMLKIVETEDNAIISEDEYNTIYKDLFFGNITGDYKETSRIHEDFVKFCGMLDREIDNQLLMKNDALKRIDAQLQQGLTPEMIEEMTKNKADIVKAIEKKTKPSKSRTKATKK